MWRPKVKVQCHTMSWHLVKSDENLTVGCPPSLPCAHGPLSLLIKGLRGLPARPPGAGLSLLPACRTIWTSPSQPSVGTRGCPTRFVPQSLPPAASGCSLYRHVQLPSDPAGLQCLSPCSIDLSFQGLGVVCSVLPTALWQESFSHERDEEAITTATYWHRKQTYGYQRGKRGRDKLGVWD